MDQTLTNFGLDHEYAIATTDGDKTWAKPTQNYNK